MLAIVNVTPEYKPEGVNQYEVRINRRVLARFEHERTPNGAAQCLRDAADAVENCPVDNQEEMMQALIGMLMERETDASWDLSGEDDGEH